MEHAMNYRTLGRTGLSVSEIGLGTEYLVKASQETVSAVVRQAVDAGINYFDVLFADPDYRDHFGAAFQGLRDRVIVTGHLPVFDSVEACRASFQDHLARLRIDFVDVLFVSCCDGEERCQSALGPGGHLELAQSLVDSGLARFIGFSSHTLAAAVRAVESGAIDVLMFPINPAFDTLPGDTGSDDLGRLWDAAYERRPEDGSGALPARKQLYHLCASRQVGLVAMKPFAAGWLFRPDLNPGFHPVNLIHYALSQPGVSCVVPGAASPEQLEQDLDYFSASPAQKDLSAAIAASRWNVQGACMYCSHCQPCTAGIDIAAVNRLLDTAKTGALEVARRGYQQLEALASSCQACGDCLQRCPFGIQVIERMEEAAQLFEPV
jgi:predicted aldo/keto reductase-like oxidoreductase